MIKDKPLTPEEIELKTAIEAVLSSPAQKKLVIAGPGTGKTTLFKQLLKLADGEPDHRIVLTFINSLKNDLETELAGLAQVYTLHSFCLGLLHRNGSLRGNLSQDFLCYPGLATLIAQDWEIIKGTEAPHFVKEMRTLAEGSHIPFYLERGAYYNAVDFDDTVFRAHKGLVSGHCQPGNYDLVLIDEYQDFNRLEAGIIDVLGEANPILIAGDDDQALYSQLRNASWDYIRFLSKAGDYKVFELPFCMRCPKVIVDAVGDVLAKANELHKLEGRIDKPYKHFPPVKGLDSAKYSKIANIQTSVQGKRVNYMGRFIAQEIAKIPEDEIEAAVKGGYPFALVIVAQPYRDQIITYLEDTGFEVDTKTAPADRLSYETGLLILKENKDSNLGWRIVLAIDKPSFMHNVILSTTDGTLPLADAVPSEYREATLKTAQAYSSPDGKEEPEGTEDTTLAASFPAVRVTSFESSKGLSAQHVFIAGLHNGELPHNPSAINDLEICKFVVGLTRTRKKCTLVHTQHFGANWKSPSSFISWINSERLDFTKVDKSYWPSQNPE